MSLPRYEKYKDSGVEWLGEVPEHWEVGAIKRYFTFLNNRRVPLSSEERGNKNGNFPYYGASGIIDWIDEYIFDDDLILVSEDGANLLNRSTPIAFIAYGCYWVNNHAHILAPPDKNLIFWSLLIESIDLVPFITGSAQPKLTYEALANILIASPTDVNEIEKISYFLNQETTKIDDLIDESTNVIVLLKEKRQALISHAVTKGLNPDVPMKDSGVEWLGEVPEHWEVFSLKYAVSMKSGEQITSESIEDSGDYPVFGGNGHRGYTSEFTHDGFFPLIGRQGALCGNINYANGKFWASEHAVVVSPKLEYSVTWLGELMRSMNLGQYSVAAAQPGLSVEAIGNLRIPFPSLFEQEIIVKFLNQETTKIDDLIAESQNVIELLKERRSALISSAVTGKIDVRNYHA